MDIKSAKMQPTRHWPPDCAYGDRKTLKTRLSKEKEEQGLSYEATAAFKNIIPLDPPKLSMRF